MERKRLRSLPLSKPTKAFLDRSQQSMILVGGSKFNWINGSSLRYCMAPVVISAMEIYARGVARWDETSSGHRSCGAFVLSSRWSSISHACRKACKAHRIWRSWNKIVKAYLSLRRVDRIDTIIWQIQRYRQIQCATKKATSPFADLLIYRRRRTICQSPGLPFFLSVKTRQICASLACFLFEKLF